MNQILRHVYKRTAKTLVHKAQEYSTDEDRLIAFKEIAILEDVSITKAIEVLRAKHLVSIKGILDGLELGNAYSNEYIDEKFGDFLNYTLLLECAVRELNSDNFQQYQSEVN